MAIDALTEEVAQGLEGAAEVTRRFNVKSAGFILGGIVIGFSCGFAIGHRYNREKIKAEAFRDSQDEVRKIREAYRQQQKNVTVIVPEKPSVEEVIEDLGYNTGLGERPLKPPVPVFVPHVTQSPEKDWDYAEELKKRNNVDPYVIHQDEFRAHENNFSHVTYTYYAEDDVLVDEDDTPLPHADLIVGVNNLRWGHGTDDDDVVYVRNPRLELEAEICRVHKSYEREVLGIGDDESDST
jgi:hypothetical protein